MRNVKIRLIFEVLIIMFRSIEFGIEIGQNEQNSVSETNSNFYFGRAVYLTEGYRVMLNPQPGIIRGKLPEVFLCSVRIIYCRAGGASSRSPVVDHSRQTGSGSSHYRIFS